MRGVFSGAVVCILSASVCWAMPTLEYRPTINTTVATGALIKRSDCPEYFSSITLLVGKKKHTLYNLEFLGSGYQGCAYTTRWDGEPVVAKLPIFKGLEVDPQEIEALNVIGELYATGYDLTPNRYTEDDPAHHFVVMKFHSGKPIREVDAWNEYVGTGLLYMESGKSVKECRAFFETFTCAIEKNVREYARKYGVWHGDVDFKNVLFNEEGTKAQLIDWGHNEFINKRDIPGKAAILAAELRETTFRPTKWCPGEVDQETEEDDRLPQVQVETEAERESKLDMIYRFLTCSNC